MQPSLKLIASGIFTAVALTACADENNETDIPVSEVPANIIAIVQNALPGIKLDGAEKKPKHNSFIYKLEGKLINGREYEIKISDNGTILKIELED